VHAAIIAINDAVDHRIAMTTVNCLLNPAAHMSNIIPELSDDYQTTLYDAKQIKKEIAFNKVTHTRLYTQWCARFDMQASSSLQHPKEKHQNMIFETICLAVYSFSVLLAL